MPIENLHSNMSEGLNAPYDNAAMVTPSDTGGSHGHIHEVPVIR